MLHWDPLFRALRLSPSLWGCDIRDKWHPCSSPGIAFASGICGAKVTRFPGGWPTGQWLADVEMQRPGNLSFIWDNSERPFQLQSSTWGRPRSWLHRRRGSVSPPVPFCFAFLTGVFSKRVAHRTSRTQVFISRRLSREANLRLLYTKPMCIWLSWFYCQALANPSNNCPRFPVARDGRDYSLLLVRVPLMKFLHLQREGSSYDSLLTNQSLIILWPPPFGGGTWLRQSNPDATVRLLLRHLGKTFLLLLEDGRWGATTPISWLRTELLSGTTEG